MLQDTNKLFLSITRKYSRELWGLYRVLLAKMLGPLHEPLIPDESARILSIFEIKQQN